MRGVGGGEGMGGWGDGGVGGGMGVGGHDSDVNITSRNSRNSLYS